MSVGYSASTSTVHVQPETDHDRTCPLTTCRRRHCSRTAAATTHVTCKIKVHVGVLRKIVELVEEQRSGVSLRDVTMHTVDSANTYPMLQVLSKSRGEANTRTNTRLEDCRACREQRSGGIFGALRSIRVLLSGAIGGTLQTPCRVNTVEHRGKLLTKRDHPENCGTWWGSLQTRQRTRTGVNSRCSGFLPAPRGRYP